MGFLGDSDGKESACSVEDLGLIPGLGRSLGEGNGYPLWYSQASLVAQLVKNPPAMQETWVGPWVGKIPWRRERLPTPVFWPGKFHGLYSPWDRKESDSTEQLSLVFLPGEFHGQRNLPGYSPWGCKESDVTNSFIFITYLDFFTNHITIIQW